MTLVEQAAARFPFQVFKAKDAAARLARTCGRDDPDVLYCVERVAGGFAVASYDRKDGAPLGRI